MGAWYKLSGVSSKSIVMGVYSIFFLFVVEKAAEVLGLVSSELRIDLSNLYFWEGN